MALDEQRWADTAMIGEGFQGFLGHGVDGVGAGQAFDIKYVGGLGILGTGAGPQESLGPNAEIHNTLHAGRIEERAVGMVSTSRHRNPQGILQISRYPVHDGLIPATDKDRGHRTHLGRQAGFNPPLNTAQIGFCGRLVLLGGEEQRYVDWDSCKDSLLDGRQALFGAGNLDEQIGPVGLLMETFDCRKGTDGVVGQCRRDLQ